MISRIALALAIAAVSTSASAQTNKQSWQDLLKPYEAKTNPNVPLAPPQPAAAVAPLPEVSTTLKDACVVKAIGHLPNINGMRVTHSSYKFYQADGQSIIGQVFVSVEVNGHQAHYKWLCGVTDSGIIVLTAFR